MNVVLIGALEGNTGTIRRIGIGTNHKALTLGMRSLQQKHEKKEQQEGYLGVGEVTSSEGRALLENIRDIFV